MTLRELIKSCPYKEVFNCLYNNYYKKKTEDEVYESANYYRKALQNLLDLRRNGDPQYTIRVDLDSQTELNDIYMINLKTNSPLALDLSPWEDLIECEVVASPPQTDPSLVLAHLLWELTFYGFNNKEIHMVRQELENIDRNTNE
jgi:hypothetical protein